MRLPALAIVGALLTAGAPPAQAQPSFPEPSGPFGVGRFDADVTDSARDEVFTDDPTDKRRLLVTVYYPATVPAEARRAAYGTAELAAASPLFTDDRRTWLAPAYADVPAAEGPFPVVLFSPGLGNLTLYYSTLLAEIASRGFVVAALWHPYSTQVVAFADGTVLRSNAAGGVGGIPPDEQQARLERLGGVWAGDQRFVLDELSAWNAQHSLLRDRLDLRRVGAFGHSLGGAAAVHAAHGDERIDAAINMDGAMFGAVTSEGSRAPFLLMRAEIPVPTDAELQQLGMTREQVDARLKSILDLQATMLARSKQAREQLLAGARHNTFMTDILFFPSAAIPAERRTALVGNVDPAMAFRDISRSVAEFMTAHVRKQ
jgi:predicted dienelactone hydrolase